ncbi:unnamed protein product [Dovyalis caffra]|uniref:DUF7795 domain-containing protein n=1 Tax=Dovyalis caffra TaxID=77055 RepID=A0AAV1QSA7_9ROSI|nr:unnamed protein product [Dovyalis caffra]
MSLEEMEIVVQVVVVGYVMMSRMFFSQSNYPSNPNYVIWLDWKGSPSSPPSRSHSPLGPPSSVLTPLISQDLKLDELANIGSRFLNGYQQALEFLRRPPIDRISQLIENIIKANETKRVKSYIEAGCVNVHDSIQNTNKSKTLLNELEHLLEDLSGAIQTANECLSPLNNEDCCDQLYQELTIDQVEKSSFDLGELEMTHYVVLMGIIYSMVKQDYVMQERIVNSLNFKSLSGELESYCVMWSLRPFIKDEVMHHAWRLIRESVGMEKCVENINIDGVDVKERMEKVSENIKGGSKGEDQKVLWELEEESDVGISNDVDNEDVDVGFSDCGSDNSIDNISFEDEQFGLDEEFDFVFSYSSKDEDECRHVLRTYEICDGYPIPRKKNDKVRLVAYYEEIGCEWKFYASQT